MPSSAVRTFADPDEYAAAIRGGVVGFTVNGRGKFTAKLARIDLDRMWMQRFSDNLPRIADVTDLLTERAYFTFLTRPGPSLVQAGAEISASVVTQHARLQEYFQRSSDAASFGTMSLPLAELAAVGEAMGGFDLGPPSDVTPVTPPPAAMARLQRLHAAAGRLAEDAPEIIANPDAARGLEAALADALIDCLAQGQGRTSTLAQGQHAIVMRRFRRIIEENPDQPLYIPEICTAIGVPERTLRLCCQEHLGMAPKRYLVLRRLHQTRRALQKAAPDQTTVTDAAMRYGFWQLGRFAVEYRALFGEPPSATLRRPPEVPPPQFAEIA